MKLGVNFVTKSTQFYQIYVTKSGQFIFWRQKVGLFYYIFIDRIN